MGAKAKAVYSLYKRNRITIEGVKDAVLKHLISAEDYKKITGKVYDGEAEN